MRIKITGKMPLYVDSASTYKVYVARIGAGFAIAVETQDPTQRVSQVQPLTPTFSSESEANAAARDGFDITCENRMVDDAVRGMLAANVADEVPAAA